MRYYVIGKPIQYEQIVEFIDSFFTKGGYGFVNREQIKTEVLKGRSFLALEDNSIIGVRLGTKTIWTLAVHPDYRGQGIGRKLLEMFPCETIRVKAEPVGHLSNAQKKGHVDPTPFYEKCGFKLWGRDAPKNFFQKGKGYHKEGKTRHIKVYKNPDTLLFEGEEGE